MLNWFIVFFRSTVSFYFSGQRAITLTEDNNLLVFTMTANNQYAVGFMENTGNSQASPKALLKLVNSEI